MQREKKKKKEKKNMKERKLNKALSCEKTKEKKESIYHNDVKPKRRQ